MAYREENRRPVDLEIDALHDLLARIRRVRRRVALPVMLLAAVAVSLGVAAHVLGYWSVFGTDEDGRYLLGAFTVFSAGLLAMLPILVPGTLLYAALRARTRRAWRIAHARAGVAEEWLDANVNRYG
jgi:hypothetical protein